MKKLKRFETIIIGGGQAGLSVSHYLQREGRDHIILERAAEAANAWRNHRWDSFTLNTPNWQSRLAGAPIPGKDPDGFLSRNEIVKYFEEFIQKNRPPIWYGTHVFAVDAVKDGYIVRTTAGMLHANNVVVATGLHQKPRIPQFKGALSPKIRQLHSDSYRNPDSLAAGAVLVVGSAQSGAQIAEELYQSGRKVYLSVSRSGRVPRRYRGRDINLWSHILGLYERSVDELSSRHEKFGGKPHISGTQGGHTLNLHQFAADGVNLLGRVTELDGEKVRLARDLHLMVAAADRYEANLVTRIDSYIERRSLAMPQETLPHLAAGFEQPERDELDLTRANVNSVIWATGYSFDFTMVRLPVFDADGYPVQQRGVSEYAGLYFVGLPWLHNAKSGLLFGVPEDAAYIASHIIERDQYKVLNSTTYEEAVLPHESWT
ncbi:NAD(P)-binding domain-containing protein [Alloacidobacterium dinghuense]|uniref:NAD(P)-binding domain-containing protein n=1 Tax=Alloacidobacterium dinghuense TaxID=2763107 RepID=A0A7G8BMS1_9BACT|nr:NAD(P)-binding domain-containing protein [Alloacidobacterium dinghuense]QNI33841.1 NAD(P)-binding domain-containing protein [Alloacidobacterium dinghuense]